MKGVTLHPHAFTELMEQAEYYDQERAGVGLEFLADIERTFERLLDEPELGAAIGPNLRAFSVGRFPHSVVYGPAADGAELPYL